jgi:DNA-binding SARP family transcriptional activator
MDQLSIYLLGAPRLEQDGRLVELDTRKAVALLAYLLMSGIDGGGHQSRETLAALLWPEYDEKRARAALRRTLSTLRHAVAERYLMITRDIVALEAGPGLWSDVIAFRQSMAAWQTHDHPPGTECEVCLADLETAVSLYQGDFMAGFSLRDSVEFDDWQLAQTELLRRDLSVALSRLVQGYCRLGLFEQAIQHANRWLELDPLREEVYRWLMQLYALDGRRDAALQQYRACVRILAEELGVEPLPETTALYEAIQEGRLEPPIKIAGATAGSSPAGKPPLTLAYPLIGRESAWAALERAHHHVATGGQFMAITGEAGIGKTRLLVEYTADAQTRGAIAVVVRCYEGETSLAYAPFVAALQAALRQPNAFVRLADLPAWQLSEAARLTPELASAVLDLPVAPDLEAVGGQGRFFDAVGAVLVALCSGPLPGILAFDDAQWADVASLDLLAYLVRRLSHLPLLIMITWRHGQIEATQRLSQLLADARRGGNGSQIALSRWEVADVERLVSETLSHMTLPANFGQRLFSQRLYEETEGLPYFVAEYLSTLTNRSDDHAWTAPQSVRDLLLARLANLDEASRQLLQTAAVIGRTVDYDVLQAASGRSDEETVAALEHLLAARLLEERPESNGSGRIQYDFDHQQLRALVYEELSLARRRLLHRRVAHALIAAARTPHDQGATAGLIGYHYHRAGQDGPAADYYRQAGDYARSLYANREALHHFQRALALGHPETAILHEASGDLQTLLGEYSAALHSYETAAAMNNEQLPPGMTLTMKTPHSPLFTLHSPLATPHSEMLARLEHKIGRVYDRRGDWELAEHQYEAARERWGTAAAPAVVAHLLVDWSRAAFQRGNATRAQTLAQEAVVLAESSEDTAALAQTHNLLGILARHRDDLLTARAYLEQSLYLAKASGDAGAHVAALNNLARVVAAGGDVAQGIALLEKALVICRQRDDRHREAALLNHLADLLHRDGREEEAMAHLKQAVTIYAEIGAESGDWQPEIWKLTEW